MTTNNPSYPIDVKGKAHRSVSYEEYERLVENIPTGVAVDEEGYLCLMHDGKILEAYQKIALFAPWFTHLVHITSAADSTIKINAVAFLITNKETPINSINQLVDQGGHAPEGNIPLIGTVTDSTGTYPTTHFEVATTAVSSRVVCDNKGTDKTFNYAQIKFLFKDDVVKLFGSKKSKEN